MVLFGRIAKCVPCMSKFRARPEQIQKRKEYNQLPHIKKREASKQRKTNHKNNRFKRLYGISLEERNTLTKQQDFQCKICSMHESQLDDKGLSIDHCHKTGIIRGMLCGSCNRAIGLLKEDIQILRNAINYLEEYK